VLFFYYNNSEQEDNKMSERRWTVEVDGERTGAGTVKIVSDFGEFVYGIMPNGQDGWYFHEKGGGGSVAVPFLIQNGKLLIGLIEEERYNQGGIVSNLPRGRMNPRESGDLTSQTTARLAVDEKVGFCIPKPRIFLIDGEPANPNSAILRTANEGEGVKFYGFLVFPEEVESKEGKIVFKESEKDNDAFSQTLRKATECFFVPWEEAILVADMFTAAGIARLLAHLKKMGEVIM
jgi:hypothetical protein